MESRREQEVSVHSPDPGWVRHWKEQHGVHGSVGVDYGGRDDGDDDGGDVDEVAECSAEEIRARISVRLVVSQYRPMWRSMKGWSGLIWA